MKQRHWTGFIFARKLIFLYLLILSISSLVIGITGYYIARRELNKKGEQILKNSVVQAIDMIAAEYSKVEQGIAEREETQEYIKEKLLGPMDLHTGSRPLHGNIDLGENGYFIIYNSEGYEIMHPTLEGENVMHVVDFGDNQRYLVQEQIEVGKQGGGFVYYSWMLPHSGKVAPKISYCGYFAPWDWIVVATAYELDFNRAANMILLAIILTMTVLILLVGRIIIIYVKKLATPIMDIVKGMSMVANQKYKTVEKNYHKDEIALLTDGYNRMVGSLKSAKEDIESKEAYISHLAFHDDLTGLPNRHGIEAHVKDRIMKGCTQACMIQMDIVGLKVINSTLGFRHGDQLIEIIAEFFSDKQAPDFFFSRTSSNEFTLWVEKKTYQEIETLIYSLRSSVKDYLHTKGFGQIVDMQMAITQYPLQGSGFTDLYERTSMAMKVAKDSNSLQLQEYHEDIRKTLESELSMRRYLEQALKEEEILAYYQAQVDFITGQVKGVEALARWNSKKLGLVSPSVFIPAIDSQNLVSEFSNYMIERVLSDYEKLKEKYNADITLSINISPAYFMDSSCYEYLKASFQRHSVPPEKLTLEITEDVFISKPEKINGIIERLHNLGVRISIDDFGTGYSSLNYLTNMNFDEMKIDKSFVQKILEKPKAFQLFEVLCNIARIYDYDIVAEGVETELQLEKIKTTSLRIIQGFLFSRPEPLE